MLVGALHHMHVANWGKTELWLRNGVFTIHTATADCASWVRGSVLAARKHILVCVRCCCRGWNNSARQIFLPRFLVYSPGLFSVWLHAGVTRMTAIRGSASVFCFDAAVQEKMQNEKRGKATMTSKMEGLQKKREVQHWFVISERETGHQLMRLCLTLIFTVAFTARCANYHCTALLSCCYISAGWSSEYCRLSSQEK